MLLMDLLGRERVCPIVQHDVDHAGLRTRDARHALVDQNNVTVHYRCHAAPATTIIRYIPNSTASRRTSATLQAWAKQPTGRYGSSASQISWIWPMQNSSIWAISGCSHSRACRSAGAEWLFTRR